MNPLCLLLLSLVLGTNLLILTKTDPLLIQEGELAATWGSVVWDGWERMQVWKDVWRQWRCLLMLVVQACQIFPGKRSRKELCVCIR